PAPPASRSALELARTERASAASDASEGETRAQRALPGMNDLLVDGFGVLGQLEQLGVVGRRALGESIEDAGPRDAGSGGGDVGDDVGGRVPPEAEALGDGPPQRV